MTGPRLELVDQRLLDGEPAAAQRAGHLAGGRVGVAGLPPSRSLISIILADRSIAASRPPSSRSQTSDAATPWPQPTSSRRSAGRTSRVSTAQTNRSDALPAMPAMPEQ